MADLCLEHLLLIGCVGFYLPLVSRELSRAIAFVLGRRRWQPAMGYLITLSRLLVYQLDIRTPSETLARLSSQLA